MIEPYLGLQPVFARHETFQPRYGWLRKAVVSAERWPDVFVRPDATVLLGVGKNMVRAIRYWGQAFDLLVEVHNPERLRVPNLAPSSFGLALLSDDGWDPYIEDVATLWLLHWRILRPPCLAPVWSLTFNKLPALELSEEDLVDFIADTHERVPGWSSVVRSSLKKDVDCLLRMYTSRLKTRESPEDELDAPFRQLGLIEIAPDRRSYRFPVGPKPTLPDSLIAYATLDFLAYSGAPAKTATVPWLAMAPGGPGRAFKLSEAALGAALERYAATPGALLELHAPAGVLQVAFHEDPRDAARKLLVEFYAARTGRRRALAGGAEEAELARLHEAMQAETDPLKRLALKQIELQLEQVGR